MILAAVLLGLAHPSLPGHPGSVSQSQVVVEGAEVRVVFAFQTLTLEEELRLDRDGDAELSPSELEAARATIEGYLLEHFRVLDAGRGHAPLAGRVEALATTRRAEPRDEQWIEARLAFTAEDALADVAVELDAFRGMNPGHLDYASLVWNGHAPAYYGFGLGVERWDFDTPAERRPGVARDFLRRGAAGVAAGPEALLLLCAVLLAGARGRGAWTAAAVLVAAVVAGIAWGALAPWVPPRSFLGLAGSLASAYVACDALLRSTPRTALPEAGLFGAVIGLFVGVGERTVLADEPLAWTAGGSLLLGAVGVLVLAAIVAPVALGLVGRVAARGGGAGGDDGAPRWLVEHPARTLLLVAVAAVAFWRFAARAGFLP